MENSVIAIPFQYIVITTIIVYALLAPIFLNLIMFLEKEKSLLLSITIRL